MESATTLTVSCLCNNHNFNTSIPTSTLPLSARACHCTSCRHTTGALYTNNIPWPHPASTLDLSSLMHYPMFPNLHLLFCPTCSSPLFFHRSQQDWLGALTGALPNLPNLIRQESHIFVADTLDGGASNWLRKCNPDGVEAKRWTAFVDSELLPYDWPDLSSLKGAYERRDIKSVTASCHCKGVQFSVRQGEYAGKSRAELPFFIDPTTYKNLGGFDACDTCRKSSGVDVFNWTFSELKYLTWADGNAFPEDVHALKKAVDDEEASVGTLTYFQSSEGVQRYFCKTCTACVFYAAVDRPDIVDVAIGVLESSDGARAEGFLAWAFGGKMVHAQDVIGGWRQEMVRMSEEECDRWREDRAYPKNWRRVEREEAERKGEKYY